MYLPRLGTFISYIVKLYKQQLQGAANAQQQLRNLPDDDKLHAVFFSIFFFFLLHATGALTA